MRQLSRLYRINEAGTLNAPTSKTKHANGGAMRSDDDEEEEEDDLGPDMDYEDPSPPEPAKASTSSRSAPKATPEVPTSPFASKSQPPSKALQGGKTDGTVKADKRTMQALIKALDSVRTADEDLQDWIDDVVREAERVVRSGGDLALPKFEATPGLDDFDDDTGADDEEDY